MLEVAKVYPNGIHGAIAGYLAGLPEFEVRTATLDEPEHGLTDEVLGGSDVLVWWGHAAHNEVHDDIMDRVQRRVLSGCCFFRGRGKIFYFQPGHETYPIYFQDEIRQVIANAVRWASPVAVVGFRDVPEAPN